MGVGQKVALITGANRGIGREITRQLAAKDIAVFVAARHLDAASRTVSELGLPELRPIALDVTSPPGDLLAQVKSWKGRLDILVNNAGIYQAGSAPDGEDAGSVLDAPLDALRATLETNTLGPLRLCQILSPLMRASPDGRIVNISSGMGQLAGLGSDSTAYRISKVALNAVTLQLHAALKPRVKVFAACPGWVRTDMGGRHAPKTVEEGADTPVWLATSPEPVSGNFYQERRRIAW